MSEMNNITAEETATVSKRKPNLAILIVTWALAVALLVVGIVSLVKGKSEKLTLDNVASISKVEYGESYEFTFTPSQSDSYYFYVEYAQVTSITYGDNYSKAINLVGSGLNYRVYAISLSQGKKYTFTVTPTSRTASYINAKISDSYLDDDDSSSDDSSSSNYWGW